MPGNSASHPPKYNQTNTVVPRGLLAIPLRGRSFRQHATWPGPTSPVNLPVPQGIPETARRVRLAAGPGLLRRGLPRTSPSTRGAHASAARWPRAPRASPPRQTRAERRGHTPRPRVHDCRLTRPRGPARTSPQNTHRNWCGAPCRPRPVGRSRPAADPRRCWRGHGDPSGIGGHVPARQTGRE